MIKFPEESPLEYEAFLQLCEMNWEVRKAMRYDSARRGALPSLDELRAWGRRYLRGVEVVTDSEEVLCHKGDARYKHHGRETYVAEDVQYCDIPLVCDEPVPSSEEPA